MRLVGLLLLVAVVSTDAQTGQDSSYTVFLRSRPIGREDVAVVRQADGWIIRGSNTLGPPLDSVTRNVEIHYDDHWRPRRFQLEGTTRGQDVSVTTTFADGKANNALNVAGTSSNKVDDVASDTLVLPNVFLGSNAALAKRLVGVAAGATFRAYIVPQIEIAIRVDGVFQERIDTPKQSIAATRYALVVAQPGGDLVANVWTDSVGTLLRFSVPAQALEMAREDIASAAARTTAFSLPGDEAVQIPASGFNLAANVTKPATATRPLPAIILIGGSGPIDRDGSVAGIPVLGQMARHFVDAGFFVVRYDKRGVGQSGGRTEASTISDYAEDVRAIITWLEKRRKDVDKKRIGIVGHSEGAWVALNVGARDKRVRAVTLIAGAATTGAELVLAQQQHVLNSLKLSDAERQAKIDLQKRIQAAVLTGAGWDQVPPDLRGSADTPWFQSFLAYDPARIMKTVRQPLLIVHGELDTQVPPHHADRLVELARARKRTVTADVVKVPGVNHLLVPAKTGEVAEYPTLPVKELSTAALSSISAWMAKALGSP